SARGWRFPIRSTRPMVTVPLDERGGELVGRSLPHPVQGNICLCSNGFQFCGCLVRKRTADGVVGAIHTEGPPSALEKVRLDGAECHIAIGGCIDAISRKRATEHAAVAQYSATDGRGGPRRCVFQHHPIRPPDT